MKKMTRMLLVCAVCLFSAACGQASEDISPGSGPSNTSTPSLLPSATNTPVPPSATPTSTPIPSGPCDNPLMSLDVGNRWQYHATSSLGASDYSLSVLAWDESVGLNAVIEMANLGTGIMDNDLVTCLDGGGIEDFPLFFVSMQLGDYVDGVLNTYYQSGIYAPPYQDLVDAGWQLEWEAEYLTEEPAGFKKVMGDTSLSFGRSVPIDLKFSTQGKFEPVTVPAGTFPNALKVSFSLRMATTVTTPGLSAGAPLNVIATQWYEPFVGLVRSEVVSSFVELLPGQNTSAPIQSVVELSSFQVAP